LRHNSNNQPQPKVSIIIRAPALGLVPHWWFGRSTLIARLLLARDIMRFETSRLIATLALCAAASGAGIGPQRILANNHVAGNAPPPNRGNTALFPFLTRLRDDVIEFLFGQHPTKASQSSSSSSPSSSYKNNIRSQYANELVLRFNISTADEESSLSDAVARLFLDVWAYNGDFVDVRLHSDEVMPLLGLLPKSLRTAHSTLIPDLAAAVYQSLPFDGNSQRIDAGSDPRTAVTPLTANDNVFFQDYQPVPVIIRWMRLLEAMFPTCPLHIDWQVLRGTGNPGSPGRRDGLGQRPSRTPKDDCCFRWFAC
jgi:extracellular matrix protein 14